MKKIRPHSLSLSEEEITMLLSPGVKQYYLPVKDSRMHGPFKGIICDQSIDEQLYEMEFTAGHFQGERKWCFYPYRRGHIFYVKEHFAHKSISEEPPGEIAHYRQADPFACDKWLGPNRMKQDLSRIWFSIETVQLKSMMEINVVDVLEQGIMHLPLHIKQKLFPGSTGTLAVGPVDRYIAFWKYRFGADSWKDENLVWAMNIKFLSTTGKPSSLIL